MANRYAVATGNWNATSTWSDSDGGAPGASAPVNGDNVYLTATSGAITVTCSAAAACTTLICTGFTGTLAMSNYGVTVYGDCTIPSGMTITWSSTTPLEIVAAATVTGGTATGPQLTLSGTGAVTLNSAGTDWAGVKVVGGSKTVTLASDLSCTILNASENYGNTTFAGAYNITCGTLGMGYISGVALTFVSGQTVTVTAGMYALSSPISPSHLKASTASSAVSLVYSGAPADFKISGLTITDMDASGSSQPLYIWYGGTFTRTTNIVNITSASVARPARGAALAKVAFVMRDATTLAPATGKTVSCTRSLDGGAFAAGTLGGSGTATELSNGIYTIDFAAADMAGNTVTLRAAATGCEDTFVTMVTAYGTVASGTAIGGPAKNVALAKYVFVMRDSTTHAPAASKTVTCTRSIDGAAFDAGTLGSPTEISNGAYYVDFGAGDLNGNVIVLRATASGCDDTFVTLVTGS